MKFLILFFLVLTCAEAGFPPTTSRISGESVDSTTFTFRFPNFTGTRSSSIISLGVNSVAGGGTGLGTLTASNLIIGAGTSNVTFIAPGAANNVLVSNGSTWSSAISPITCKGHTANCDIFAFTYGATASTNCVSGTCAYLDQLGNNVSSVVRGGSAGAYTANLTISYTKVKCTFNGIVAGSGPAMTYGITGTGSSFTFQTLNTTPANSDTNGTLTCIGIY